MVKNSIALNPGQDYTTALKEMKGLGVLRAGRDLASGTIVLHERGWKEFAAELFIPGRAEAARQLAANALTQVFSDQEASVRLMENIWKRLEKKEDITGAMLSQGFTPVASKQSDSIGFIAAPAEKVECNCAILRTKTARDELRRKDPDFNNKKLVECYAKLSTFREGVCQAFSNPSAPAKIWICSEDLSSLPAGTGKTSLSTDQLKMRLKSALSQQQGAVVIEPMPDQYAAEDKTNPYRYTDEGLAAQLKAVRDAMLWKSNLTVSFACENQDVLERLKAMQKDWKAGSASGLAAADFPKQAPGEPGLHYLSHLPLELYAERLIMPSSLLDETRLKAITGTEIKENKEGAFEGIQGVQLVAVAVPDRPALDLQLSKKAGAEDRQRELKIPLAERFEDALRGATGRVVIYPGSRSIREYREILPVINKALEDNPALSISIVQPADERQGLLEAAMVPAGRGEEAPELDWKEI